MNLAYLPIGVSAKSSTNPFAKFLLPKAKFANFSPPNFPASYTVSLFVRMLNLFVRMLKKLKSWN